MLNRLKKEIEEAKNPEQAKILQRFFKTGKGEYGEGDIFLGIKVPIQRKIAKGYTNLSFMDLQTLLNSKIHEERLIALIILTNKYQKSKKDFVKKRQIFEFYLKNTHNINNWDLVDLSAPNIVGDFSSTDGTEVIRFLAKSKNLWERRIAIVSTYAFIKKRIFGETLAIADMLLKDEHDLIHKAVGWMLREVGKRNQEVLEIFLKERYKTMPRTMLRYSIEKFPEEKRKAYLKGEI
ncbi:MAG TPA: DNA alkylation repair protein [Candidatus Pacearchaeota archaeon]|jgi:3-methyladenine DNA glycosylase AlkD|nr:DNA alkylation repair protein [Candidatus Pacearchaeota archaeon]HNZ51775.1 DNA alkylation repair protein [Candidatus Pacearchaeota archaeon]HOC97150.1 DNA alkylation repair protein [Candidatus Pacearchaeota archaeon]HOH03895.1 DNA alkylation repair protein [Candidatus Pacearchaeota archaeon]HPX74287.1 DNA alkylation repair protein [Candidatus Pacearchaeota archaeon]